MQVGWDGNIFSKKQCNRQIIIIATRFSPRDGEAVREFPPQNAKQTIDGPRNYRKICAESWPIASMYGIFTYMKTIKLMNINQI